VLHQSKLLCGNPVRIGLEDRNLACPAAGVNALYLIKPGCGIEERFFMPRGGMTRVCFLKS
jgi:hypothetical protein